MEKLKTIIKWLLPMAGLLVVALGAVLIFRGLNAGTDEYALETALDGMFIFIGIAMILSGISELIAFIRKEDKSKSKPMVLIGVTSIVLGIYVIFGEGMESLIFILPLAFSIWIITASLLRIQAAWDSKKEGSSWWVFLLSFGFLGVALGLFTLFSTLLGTFIVIYALAFIFIVHGVHAIFVFFPRKPVNSEKN